MRQVDITTEITINVPPAKVAEYAADPDHAPVWYDNIKEVKWLTPKPISVGTKVAFVAHFLGRKLSYTYEVSEFIPGKKLVMQTADGPFPMKTVYLWEKTPSGQTLMTLRNAGTPTGFSKLLSPFIKSMMKKANAKDLRKLKHILEKD